MIKYEFTEELVRNESHTVMIYTVKIISFRSSLYHVFSVSNASILMHDMIHLNDY